MTNKFEKLTKAVKQVKADDGATRDNPFQVGQQKVMGRNHHKDKVAVNLMDKLRLDQSKINAFINSDKQAA